jgi:putative FmdB family regulatory protein
MPTYEFRCPAGHEFDRFYKTISTAPSEVPCPECGAIAARQLSAGAGFQFKGSGFYLTDYGKNAHRGGEGPKAGVQKGEGQTTEGQKGEGQKAEGQKAEGTKSEGGKAESREPKAESSKEKAESRERKAESSKPTAQSSEPQAKPKKE